MSSAEGGTLYVVSVAAVDMYPTLALGLHHASTARSVRGREDPHR